MSIFNPVQLSQNLWELIANIKRIYRSHWAIQTGLYAESHGIVGNDFWDPSDNTEFYFTHDDTSKDPKWWKGEPVRCI